jgi:hypothetical protein
MNDQWYSEEPSDDKQRDGGLRRRTSGSPRPPKKNPKQLREDEFNWNKVGRMIAGWLGILLAVYLIMLAFKQTEETEYEVTFTTYQSLLSEGKIADALIKKSDFNNYDFHGKLTGPTEIVTTNERRQQGATRIWLTLP